jgi:putative molybdopterin biosynthesis protein
MPLSNPTQPRLLTAQQAAERLGITKSTVYDWVNRGYIPHHRFGRLVRIDPAELEAYIVRARMDQV